MEGYSGMLRLATALVQVSPRYQQEATSYGLLEELISRLLIVVPDDEEEGGEGKKGKKGKEEGREEDQEEDQEEEPVCQTDRTR